MTLSYMGLTLYAKRLQASLDSSPQEIAIYRLQDLFLDIQNFISWQNLCLSENSGLPMRAPGLAPGQIRSRFPALYEYGPGMPGASEQVAVHEPACAKGPKFLNVETRAPSGFAALRPATVASGLCVFRRNIFFHDQKN